MTFKIDPEFENLIPPQTDAPTYRGVVSMMPSARGFTPALVRSALTHLAGLESTDYYPLYTYDREPIKHLAEKDEWTDDDKRSALFMFVKYRRILMRDGFDYYAVFPKNRFNHNLDVRTKKAYAHMDYLMKNHGIKPPRGCDLRPLEDMEQWVHDKIIEVRILNAKRNGNPAATAR